MYAHRLGVFGSHDSNGGYLEGVGGGKMIRFFGSIQWGSW
jgi:hypothetical protein